MTRHRRNGWTTSAAMRPRRVLRNAPGWAVLAALLLAGGCATPRLDAVPEAQTTQPRLFGITNARFYLDDQGLKALAQESAASIERERAALGGKPLPTAYFLAISGGGDDGAFGSGLLVGWTAHGDRP